jgi:hypothetical protein
MSMSLRWLVLAVGLLMVTPAMSQPAYKVVQRVKTAHGQLQILEDARLTRDLEKTLWETCVDPLMALGDDDPRVQPFHEVRLRKAKFRQIDATGKVVAEFNAEEGIARIESQTLGDPADPFYLVRTDNNVVCAGSYAGQPVDVYKFQDGKIAPTRGVDASGKSVAVDFYDSLKSGWKIIRNRPDDIEVDEVYCRPDFKENRPRNSPVDFKLIYQTYIYHDGRWRYAEREEPGYWESDNEFPASDKFPRTRD